jgi:hypothetical protein
VLPAAGLWTAVCALTAIAIYTSMKGPTAGTVLHCRTHSSLQATTNASSIWQSARSPAAQRGVCRETCLLPMLSAASCGPVSRAPGDGKLACRTGGACACEV